MAITVSTPGGVTIDFPDGTDQDTIRRVMSQATGQQQSRQPLEKFSGSPVASGAVDATNDELSQWAREKVQKERDAGFRPLPSPASGIPIIGGFLDEAGSVLESGLHSVTGGRLGHSYDQALALSRERDRRETEEYPGYAAATRLATGLATGGPIFSRLAPAATLAGRVAQGATVGGGVGAVEGFARGEGGVGGRLEEAGTGLKYGAGLGAVLPVAGAAVSRGYSAAADVISPTITRLRRGPEEAADEILARRIASEGSTPGQKRLDLQTGQQMARMNANSRSDLPETIADTSDQMARLTGSVYRAGGQAGNQVKAALDLRQRGSPNPYGPQPAGMPQGQQSRVMDTTERALLIRQADSARQTDRQIMREQSRRGRELYNQAYEQGDGFDLSPAITAMGFRIQQYPGPFAGRLQRAVNLFTRSGTTGNKPFYVDNVRRFDASKKALDDMIDTAQRQGQGNLVRELTQFKDDLLNVVHGVDDAGNATRNMVYQQARDEWGSAAENRQAIELGRAALREGSEVSAEQFRELTAGQRALFRVGFMDSLRTALGTRKPGNDVTQLFQQRRVQEIMQEIIPKSKGKNAVFANRPERFGEVMGREQRMVQTRNAVLGNSATAQRQADDLEFAGQTMRSMWDRFRQSPSLFNMGVEAIGSGIQQVFGYRQDVAAALARRLLETDRKAQNQILRRLMRRGGPDAFQRFADMVDRSAVAIAGTTTPAALQDMKDR